ncbi:MAG: carboxypeptidase regulatory-like domain-containing protein, partial [Bacteroidales bacterium]|nr:carboxypeptidase regulatory-like domain-containing protein [Bacteroidales bacterium]
MKKIISVLAFLFTFVSAFSCKPDNRPGEVHGTVSYRDREVADIVVSYTGDNGTYTYTTNKSGYYVIRGIPAGDYIVSVSYNGKNVDSYLKDYEKSENPSRVTILVNGYHVRNIIIPNDQDLGWDDEDDEDDEDDTTLPDAEIPILAWYSIPAAYATAERFQELKDCGFTLSFSHTTTQEEAITTLDCAEQAGIKVIVPCPEANTEAFVQAVK